MLAFTKDEKFLTLKFQHNTQINNYLMRRITFAEKAAICFGLFCLLAVKEELYKNSLLLQAKRESFNFLHK